MKSPVVLGEFCKVRRLVVNYPHASNDELAEIAEEEFPDLCGKACFRTQKTTAELVAVLRERLGKCSSQLPMVRPLSKEGQRQVSVQAAPELRGDS